MRHVLGPIREEPEDREGEDEWIIAAAETVINSVSFKQFYQVAEKRLTRWYSGEGVGTIAGQDLVIQGVRDPIKFYVRVAEKKLSPRFPHRMTKNYCVPSVSAFPFQASEPELKVSFSKAGDVMSVKIVADRQTGQREVLHSLRCPHNGKPGELSPC
jgi:hypothetical protein